MPKKKQMPQKKVNRVKSKTINRYNVFQKELADYLKETGGSKKDFKKYRSLYKEIDKTVPTKAISSIIHALILKKGEKKKVLTYTESFPFYNAKGEFGLSKYYDITLKINFDDGVERFEFEGTSSEFQSWFSGDIYAYFRNNYNDSDNMANFVLKGGDEKTAQYDIETLTTVVGTKSYVPSGINKENKSVLPKSEGKVSFFEESVLKQREMTAIAETKKMQTELELIKELKSLGFSNKEIKKRLNK